MSDDAFYAFHELFAFCASSQAQFLNMVEDAVVKDAAREIAAAELNLGQANFIYMQEILEKLIVHLRDVIRVIEARGGTSWPRASRAEQLQMCDAASEVLRKDYEWLLNRASTLLDRCKSEVSHLATSAMLAESKRAIEVSEKVAKLTRLAFIFVPLSFTSSLFGMNLNPIVKERYSLWLWVVVSVPILLLPVLFMEWHVITAALESYKPRREKQGSIRRYPAMAQPRRTEL